MAELIEFGEIAQAGQDAYIPYLPATEFGMLDVDELVSSQGVNNPQSAALLVRNGVMPRVAGVIGRSGQVIGAYDHVAVEYFKPDKELVVVPTTKQAVDQGSKKIEKPGLVTLTLESGLIRPVYAIDDESRANWNNKFRRCGGLAVMPLVHIAPLEITSIEQNGLITAKPTKKYF
jgi:hypothetical protein